MQAAKDSFFMALQQRLAALNPARTVTIDGATVPGIVVRENMEPRFTAAQAGVFYVDWGEAQVAESTRPLVCMVCAIWYASEGSTQTGVDRGRQLAEMDQELLAICTPLHTEMRDYSQAPSVDLGAGVFWSMPVLADGTSESRSVREGRSGGQARLEREAQVKVYFFLPEAGA